ncbi:MAG TPA: hypothetical protein VKR06_01900 [Ktedonosporobacter sp.]|nr:hypothetical protein [Ktedonosporobacter sp.]
MNTRFILIAALGLLIISGLVAGLFTGSMQRALAGQPMMPAAPAVSPPQGVAVATGTPAAVAPATPTMQTQMPITPLARDTFQRPDQALWGTALDGNTWGGDANNTASQVFSITGGMGKITGGKGAFNALLGQGGNNVEVLVTGSANQFAGGANLGVVLRWTDTNNWYKALIDGDNLSILKRVNGTTTTLKSVPFPAQGGVTYSIRFRAVGATLYSRAWRSDTTEPTKWLLTTNDISFTTGQVGVRVVLQNGIEIRITSFMATTASSVA